MCRILELDTDEANAGPMDRDAHFKTPARISALA
jgi:hypothetical protein